MKHERLHQSLQATAAGRSVCDGEGDSLLPGFVSAQFPRLCLDVDMAALCVRPPSHF